MGRYYDDRRKNLMLERDARPDWFNCVEGIVVEADPATLAVKVIIPSLDEDVVHDEWVEALVPWVGPDGYGPAHVPEVGSEVVLFSRMNEGVSLFYLARYNEDFRPPAEFADGSRGCKCDTVYRLLGDLLIQLASQQEVEVKAPLVRLRGGEAEAFRVEPNKTGFHGSSIARRALPQPGPTDTPLTIAIRQFLIDWGACS